MVPLQFSDRIASSYVAWKVECTSLNIVHDKKSEIEWIKKLEYFGSTLEVGTPPSSPCSQWQIVTKENCQCHK